MQTKEKENIARDLKILKADVNVVIGTDAKDMFMIIMDHV